MVHDLMEGHVQAVIHELVRSTIAFGESSTDALKGTVPACE